MVDRTIVYTGQIPLDTNILQPQRNTMVGLGALAQAVIGEQLASPAVAVDGFVLAATGPASLVLNVGPGSIYAQAVLDQTAFGSIPADITDTITLQGISLSTTALTFTPPGTGGFSTNYLVQVGLSTQDNTPVVLPYYNASNPTIPWLGPNNTGVSQNTVRQCVALIQAKAGVAASSGTQVTPAPDPGFYGLYSVTVANGATALTSGNWSTLTTAPFIPAPLMAIPQAVQSNKWTFSEDTGTANSLVVTLNPAPLAIVDGMEITVEKGANPNTGPSTIVVNGSAPIGIHTINGTALSGNEMPANAELRMIFDGAFFQLQNVTAASFGGPLFDGDATGTNTYSIANLAPPANALSKRMLLKASFANPNTGPSTLNIGLGANPIIFSNGTPLMGGEVTDQHLLSYSTALSSWEILTPSLQAGQLTPLFAPRTYFVNASTGSDSNTGLGAGTAFATITRAISAVTNLNMNGFNVTINVADGTYGPIVCQPLNGSGNVFIVGNHATPANVLIHATTGEAIQVNGVGYNLDGLAVQADADGPGAHVGAGIRSAALVYIQNISFGTCSKYHMWPDNPGTIVSHGVADGFATSFINVTGNAIYHAAASGTIETAQTILNIYGARTFTAFWSAFPLGRVNNPYSAINFISGATVVGSRYIAIGNGVLNTNGSGATFLPGNAAGTVSSGGQYI